MYYGLTTITENEHYNEHRRQIQKQNERLTSLIYGKNMFSWLRDLSDRNFKKRFGYSREELIEMKLELKLIPELVDSHLCFKSGINKGFFLGKTDYEVIYDKGILKKPKEKREKIVIHYTVR